MEHLNLDSTGRKLRTVVVTCKDCLQDEYSELKEESGLPGRRKLPLGGIAMLLEFISLFILRNVVHVKMIVSGFAGYPNRAKNILNVSGKALDK